MADKRRLGRADEHLADAVAALEINLTDAEIRRLEEPYTTQPA